MNKIIISLTFVFLLAGCATGGFQADVFARDAAGKPQFVQTGTVMSVQAVTIEGDRYEGPVESKEQIEDEVKKVGLPIIIKAAAGGGGETSSQVGAIVGGLIGSVVGSEVGEKISRKEGIELVIKLEANEKEISIVQERSSNPEINFRVGDNVRIIRSAGRSRVVPYN